MPYSDQVEARALARLLQDVQDTAPPLPKPPRPSWRRLVDAAQRLDLDGKAALRSLRRKAKGGVA